ncbi:MAG: hypothetical protein A2068_12165 [Ignavibacteria bacterium GWB2_35_6b]|nr:MAG: hypothetical protein A2068_12165 [Ignavibacteria bacterium GWB2_35_6b]
METREKAKEAAENLKENLRILAKETVYHSGNIKYLISNILQVLIRLRLKILGAVMLGVPILYFDAGQVLILNLVHSIANKGFVDVFILFAVGSIIVTWVSFAIYLMVFK